MRMGMKIFEGSSLAVDPDQAVAEATDAWPRSSPPEMVLVFTSPVRPAEAVARALADRFPSARVVGCTTAGEHLSGAHSNGGLVAAGIASPKMRWATGLIEDVATADESRVRGVVDGLFAQLGVDRDNFDPRHYFCLSFIDGLSGAEERVVPLIADALDGVSLVGGSAGDDLAFRRTEVICGDRALSGAAVIALCESGVAFTVVKHQHFVATSRTLAITRADVAQRRVYELDGLPAAVAYARALGVPRDQLTDALAFENPLAFRYQHQLYVRSIQKIHPDDSMAFYCAIEEGMVVDVAHHEDLVLALAGDLSGAAAGGPADLVIGSNCILRALETAGQNAHGEIGALFRKFSKHMIGFDTYGEQLDGLHINQTLVALALRDAKEAA
jgi:hypothetical protein